MKRALAVAAFLLLTATQAWAQFETASVVGTVRDKTGGVISEAKVTLTNTGTGVSATQASDKDGNFEFFNVKPGTYLLTAERQGFALALADNILVTVGARQRVDLGLAVGQVSEKIEVKAETPLLETDSSQRGQVVSGDMMRQGMWFQCRSSNGVTPYPSTDQGQSDRSS